MLHPEHSSDFSHAALDLREPHGLCVTDVRAVLESAADVIFSDGVSSEFLDHWTFETMQLLVTRAPARTPVSASSGR